MLAVDYFNGDTNKPLTLAFSGKINAQGVVGVPEPFGVFVAHLLWASIRLRALIEYI